MTKADLVTSVAHKTGLSKLETKAAIAAFWETVEEALIKGESLELRKIGTFRTQHRKARMARNPSTGEQVPVAASIAPVFKPSKDFKNRVNSAMSK